MGASCFSVHLGKREMLYAVHVSMNMLCESKQLDLMRNNLHVHSILQRIPQEPSQSV